MGRNANQDTSFISTKADIDTKVNAMAQSQIQSTIQLGLGELSSASGFDSAALGFESEANNILLEAGKEQVQLDTNYSNALTNAFKAVGSLFGGQMVGNALSSLGSSASDVLNPPNPGTASNPLPGLTADDYGVPSLADE